VLERVLANKGGKMGKRRSKPDRKFLKKISPLLKWYCIYCDLEFDTKKELNKHKCEESNEPNK